MTNEPGAKMPSITVKMVTVGLLILFLLVPASLISSLVSEREGRRSASLREVQKAWSERQTIRGPVLVVPLRVAERSEKAGTVYRVIDSYFLPERLDVQGALDTETRYRGIYKTTVYTAKLRFTGSFAVPDVAGLGLAAPEPLWSSARVAVGLSDLRGLKDEPAIQWEGTARPLEAGTPGEGPLRGLALRLTEAPRGKTTFSFDLDLRGSEALQLLPAGRTTTVSLKSAWPTPSFTGAFLPDTRSVTDAGFAASWKVLHINRSLPQAWTGARDDLDGALFGVTLMTPVDGYTSTLRSTKYAILFIFLTFLVFFLIEFFDERKLHPIQYLLVGAGIVLFYLLLLSLSEQMRFPWAYAVSSLGVVAVITGYAHGVFERRRVTATVGVTLTGLYAYLYTLLQLEDYALLLGSLGLFLALCAVMYATRKVDWYGLERGKA